MKIEYNNGCESFLQCKLQFQAELFLPCVNALQAETTKNIPVVKQVESIITSGWRAMGCLSKRALEELTLGFRLWLEGLRGGLGKQGFALNWMPSEIGENSMIGNLSKSSLLGGKTRLRIEL